MASLHILRPLGTKHLIGPAKVAACFFSTEAHTLSRQHGCLGKITLNRPKKLNSLSLDMVHSLTKSYDNFLMSGVKCIWLEGNGRAFCAGGDVAEIRSSVLEGGCLHQDFFFDEYMLNHKIATLMDSFAVPQISVWDGFTMGGGVGISIHGAIRVATENTMFAMPETGIGLFPDVGGTYCLPRVAQGLPMGLYIGLSGCRLKAADLIWSGLATHFCPSDRLLDLAEAIAALGDSANDLAKVNQTIEYVAGGVSPDSSTAILASKEHVIHGCFSAPSLEGVVARLEGWQGPEEERKWAAKTRATIGSMSPLSLKVTMEALRRSAEPTATVGSALSMEYRLSQRFMRPKPLSDFTEGIRAVLVDKDNNPKWSHQTMAEVSTDVVDAFFDPLDAAHPRGELKF